MPNSQFAILNSMMQWLEDRLGLKAAIHRFLSQPIPDRVGWPHILGSLLLALTAIQFLTGILLSFVYSPSPLSAYQSVQYLMHEMKGGAWLRGVHYWGASLTVIVLALHMIRTFVYAAYRKPRELTWIVGVLLLLCLPAFAQTGYLLPWDQKAYWGTVVTIKIVETVPLLGRKLSYLLNGGSTVGALTLSRFYTFHVVLFPFLITALIAAHLFLIRRFGVTVPWTNTGEEPSKTTPFYPNQMAKDAIGMAVILVFLFFLARFLPAPLGNAADPNDNTYVPRPDWYFLFLFQMLRYFKGPWEILATFVLPSLAILIFLLLPFLDQNTGRLPRKRPIALFLMVSALLLWTYLTNAAVIDTPHPPSWQRPQGIPVSRTERIKRPGEVGGLHLLKAYCFECHSMTLLGNKPSLQTLTRKRFPNGDVWLTSHLTEHGRSKIFTAKQTEELLSVLRLAAGDNPRLLYAIPLKARRGGHLFYSKACINCHTIDGQGGKKGPDLTLRLLKRKEWHMQHIRDSHSLVPNSKMPPFWHFENYEYEALAEYILYLHTP